jgi:hypothetical protein
MFYSLMRSHVLVVAYEAPVLTEQVSFSLVGFVESFNLASSWCAHVIHDMLNPIPLQWL